MKIGSIVVVKHIPRVGDTWQYIKWEPVQDEETLYIIRDMSDKDSVVFEEGIFGYHPDGREIFLRKEYVIEVLPPEDLTEFIEECCCVSKENIVHFKK